MQSVTLKEILKVGDMRFIARYSLYKDWKAKFGNLLTLPGYIIFVYFLVSFFLPFPAIYVRGTFSWYLCLILTTMMIERQIFRGIAIKHIYGVKSMIVACLLPPLMPIRLVWGNLINMTATLKAWRKKLFGDSVKKKTGEAQTKKVAWAKTEHTFLEKSVLQRYHKNLGDLLLAQRAIDPEVLQEALIKSYHQGRRVGDVLMTLFDLGEDDFLTALSSVQHTQYIPELPPLLRTEILSAFDINVLRKVGAIPFLRGAEGWAVAICKESPEDTEMILEEMCHCPVSIFYTTSDEVQRSLDVLFSIGKNPDGEDDMILGIEDHLDGHKIVLEQAVIAMSLHTNTLGNTAKDVMQDMGLLCMIDTSKTPHPTETAYP